MGTLNEEKKIEMTPTLLEWAEGYQNVKTASSPSKENDLIKGVDFISEESGIIIPLTDKAKNVFKEDIDLLRQSFWQ